MVEILIADLKQEDEDCENKFIVQRVFSSVFIFLSKNGKFFNVLQHAYFFLDCFTRIKENVQSHAAEKSNQRNQDDKCVCQSYPYPPVERSYDDNHDNIEHPHALLNQTISIADIDEPGKHQAVHDGEAEKEVQTSKTDIPRQ